MILIYVLIGILSLVRGSSQNSQKIIIDQTNGEQITNNLTKFTKQLQYAQQLIISRSSINQTILNEILKSEMPSLKIMNFGYYQVDLNSPSSLLRTKKPQTLTPKLLQTIFTSSYFYDLTQLHLVNANIDEKYFDFLSDQCKDRQLKIQKLSLDNNLIGKEGLRALSLLDMTNLKHLSVSNTLLKEAQSVEYLLQILCGSHKQQKQIGLNQRCLNQIEYLDISNTNIQPQQFIKIMQKIPQESLRNLSISNLNLHQGNKYQTPFDLRAYKTLIEKRFNNLLKLQMDWMNLDDLILQLFVNWSLPQLQYLQLSRNFIGDKGLKKWVGRKNMPKLKFLNLYSNDISEQGLKYIIDQYPNLSFINIGKNLIKSSQLRNLSELPLQALNLKLSKIEIEDLQYILENMNCSLVKQISLSNNNHIQQLFKFINFQRYRNLQILYIKNSFIGQSLLQIMKDHKKPLSLSLKYIWFNDIGITGKIMQNILKDIVRMFPKIQFISLVQNKHQEINLTSLISNSSSENNLTVQLSHITFKMANRRIQIIKLKSLLLLIKHSSKYSVKDLPNNISKYIHQLNQFFQLSTLKELVINSHLEYQIFCFCAQTQKFNLSLQVLQVTTQLNVTELIKLLGYIGNKIRQIKLKIKGNVYLSNRNQLILSMSVFSLIEKLQIQFYWDKQKQTIQKHNLNEFFDYLHFPYLRILSLSPELQIQQIAGIIYRHSSTLRQLNLPNNFIQQLTLQILKVNNLILRKLKLSGISFGMEEFSHLGQMQLGFLEELILDHCELTDKNIEKAIQANKKSYLFVKLKILNLDQNQIGNAGLLAIFQTSLTQLSSLSLLRTHCPGYLNILLSQRTRIIQISSFQLQLDPISNNIHETSTRSVETLFIKQQSFRQQDYYKLGRCDFRRLRNVKLYLFNIYQCNVLKSIFKIAKYATFLVIGIDNEQPLLNSECMQDLNQEKNTEVESFGIVDVKTTTFIPLFIKKLLKISKYARDIYMADMRLPPFTFGQMNPQAFKYLSLLNLKNNYIDDSSFKTFGISEFRDIKHLDISHTLITVDSLKIISNQTFQKLQYLDLSGISLHENYKVLISRPTNSLKSLNLNYCELEQLSFLFKMSLNHLISLQISFNSISVTIFIDFLQTLAQNRNLMPQLKQIQIKGMNNYFEQRKVIVKYSQQLKIDIVMEESKFINFKNNAHY